MTSEAWRLRRTELRDLLNKYEKAVEDDAYGLLRPGTRELELLGENVFSTRRELLRKARETNRAFIEAFIEDIPDLCVPLESYGQQSRCVAEVRCLGDCPGPLPPGSYGSMSSILLHLLRDWSTTCDVVKSTYEPVVALLCKMLPGGEVLLPGAGLGRLALEIARKGFRVEANDASRLFLTAADFLLNRAPQLPILPVAHLFSENWSLAEQHREIIVPQPSPSSLCPEGMPPIVLVPGDFRSIYKLGGAGHRKFDAIVTCFFIDTMTDFASTVDTMDGLLGEGGVWINIGPLNWKKDAGLKLCWEEVVAAWESLGYTFLTQERLYCDYHLPQGLRMYTESY
eukprot:CAMPEP_0194536352 /NCGR_PEP_ID=MMETSP0253-20130528/75252_1 /TAXON_ID=2966 /ORGANISM="Noctiluca scintillans" /LENGTH=340 /DNA_ID=CAMNT_0039382265 /DNA_START=41 /DNA_END=1060 /DNA_ORIENTATION=+